MRAEQLKANFASNMKTLREKTRLTQVQLGEKLGYSDKTISKWENGDVMPDVATLDHIAIYFNVTVNDLIEGRTEIDFKKRKSHSLIIAGTFFGVMALACVIYVLLTNTAPIDNAWYAFLIAPPVFFIAMIALAGVFFDYKRVIYAISLLTWSIIVAIYFIFLDLNVWMLFIMGGSLQILYIFILLIIKYYRIKENKIDKIEKVETVKESKKE